MRSYDVVSKIIGTFDCSVESDDLHQGRFPADGNYAMGLYSPELLQPYARPRTVNYWFIVPLTPFDPDPDYTLFARGQIIATTVQWTSIPSIISTLSVGNLAR